MLYFYEQDLQFVETEETHSKCPSVLLFIPSGQCQIFISLSKKGGHRVFWEVLDTQKPQKWVLSQWSLSVTTSVYWSTRTFWASKSWMKTGSLPGTASALGKFFNSLLPMQMFVIASFPRSCWLSKAGIVRQAQETQKSRLAIKESGKQSGRLLRSSVHVSSGQTKNGLFGLATWEQGSQSLLGSWTPV